MSPLEQAKAAVRHAEEVRQMCAGEADAALREYHGACHVLALAEERLLEARNELRKQGG